MHARYLAKMGVPVTLTTDRSTGNKQGVICLASSMPMLVRCSGLSCTHLYCPHRPEAWDTGRHRHLTSRTRAFRGRLSSSCREPCKLPVLVERTGGGVFCCCCCCLQWTGMRLINELDVRSSRLGYLSWPLHLSRCSNHLQPAVQE